MSGTDDEFETIFPVTIQVPLTQVAVTEGGKAEGAHVRVTNDDVSTGVVDVIRVPVVDDDVIAPDVEA